MVIGLTLIAIMGVLIALLQMTKPTGFVSRRAELVTMTDEGNDG